MKFCTAALVAAGLAIAFSSAPAGSHHPVAAAAATVTRALGIGGAAGGAAVVGGGQAALGAVIVWCANNQPKRDMRRDTWVDGRHNIYPTHNPRAEGCLVKGKKDLASKGSKLWPHGK